nr:uncharacterized protein LOC112028527 [Ipomoea batatas]GMD64168.1 uncharacterized protein LOC112028527 [Ipomoea batatas]
MGRETRDPAALGSSIALLQERFRQLQRAREQREVRELKLLFEPQVMSPARSFEAGKKPVFVQESGLVPFGEGDRDPLTLGLNLSSRQADFQAMKKRALWWGDEKISVSSGYRKMENCDVDTSLHL